MVAIPLLAAEGKKSGKMKVGESGEWSGSLSGKAGSAPADVLAVLLVKQGATHGAAHRGSLSINLKASGDVATQITTLTDKHADVKIKGKLVDAATIAVESVKETDAGGGGEKKKKK